MYDCENSWVMEGREGGLTGQEVDVKEGEKSIQRDVYEWRGKKHKEGEDDEILQKEEGARKSRATEGRELQ